MNEKIKNTFGGERLIFLNEDKTSHAIGDFLGKSNTIDRRSIYDFLLFGTILPPRSVLEGVSLALPGDMGDINLYSDLNIKIQNKSVDEFVQDFDDVLSSYFDQHEEENALLLSGGVDSAIILSYMKKDPLCITWGGWGEKSTDVTFSKKTANQFGVSRHHFVYADYQKDEESYKDAVRALRVPLLFANSIPYIRMAAAGKELNVKSWFMGQNADTVMISYAPSVWVKKISMINRFLPFNPLLFSEDRKKYLFSTKSIVRLFAYYKSNGIFPGDWIKLPKGYFEEKEHLLKQYLYPNNLSQEIILTEEFLTEARRNQLYQNELPLLQGITTNCPYYTKEFVELALSIPDSIRRQDNYDKIILKKLAEKRHVPSEVINKGKKGLSYGHKDYVEKRMHIPIWDKMVKDDFLNSFVDVKKIRESKEDDFLVFDVLRSLFYFGELVVKPGNMKLSTDR